MDVAIDKPVAVERMDKAKALNGALKMSMAEAIPGVVKKDTIVPAGANNYVSEVSKGDHLRIIDLGGQQAVDF